ncbi:MAG: endonuclease/exonuclease/phosphatase family protein [Saprospiraceae bacterium]|nr:endonuclease/exonuclease/phosphatase family protein [Saprospiraceae bacterium]
MRIVISLVIAILSFTGLHAQQQYKISAVGFYNFENLFDTLDTPDVSDTEFTPNGAKRWNTPLYIEKMDHLATVVSQMGTAMTPDGVAILGTAEIENRKVLEDFVAHPKVASRNYQIVHYDSPDERGIDVALLYQPKYFKVTGSRPIPMVTFEENGERNFTRDILFVSGELDGEPLHILVNHWPSRRGGEAATAPLRNAAALQCKQVADSLMALDPDAKVIIMGDLNDDPVNASLRKVLNAKADKADVKQNGMFNPFYEFFKQGLGTLAYNDAWNLFDQIVLSYGLVREKVPGYYFYKAHVFNPPYLYQPSGQYKGYPHRTFSGDTYIGGYSDHFPVFVYLIKPK